MNDGRPSICSEAGLACETCVCATARQLAQVCKGLKGKMVGQMFVQLYTEPACARMHGVFTEAYREAEVELSAESVPSRTPVANTYGNKELPAPSNYGYERREVSFARPRAMAACA
jgi:hypothetical protein